MKKPTIIFLIIFMNFSCEEALEFKELAIKDFTIEIPAHWRLEEAQGYDSIVRRIKINEKEIIGIDLGLYSSNLIVDSATHDIIYKIIDNRTAKIVKPENFQSGTIGVYFDSLDTYKTKLQMSSINLSATNQVLFLQAIESLRFD